MEEKVCSIFISHAAVDEALAVALKQSIELSLPDHRVFVSSDPLELRLGDEWIPKILAALESAKFVLVLATRRGLDRKWVWFESGRTWFSGVPLLPCCVGSLRKGELPAPFFGRMSANIDEVRDVKLLFDSLERHFGKLAITPDYEGIATTMSRLDVRAEEREKLLQDPFAAEKIHDIEETIAKLSPAEVETIRQFVIFGELSTAGVKGRVRASGVGMERWSVPDHLIQITGWLGPKPGNKPYDDMQQNVYVINPEIRPLLQNYFLANK
jgi:hypothetical protein